MYFKNVKNLDDLKKQYRELCKVYHPDITRNKDTKIIREIIEEYHSRYKRISENSGINISDDDILQSAIEEAQRTKRDIRAILLKNFLYDNNAQNMSFTFDSFSKIVAHVSVNHFNNKVQKNKKEIPYESR